VNASGSSRHLPTRWIALASGSSSDSWTRSASVSMQLQKVSEGLLVALEVEGLAAHGLHVRVLGSQSLVVLAGPAEHAAHQAGEQQPREQADEREATEGAEQHVPGPGPRRVVEVGEHRHGVCPV
jgi:hypothetical protein